MQYFNTPSADQMKQLLERARSAGLSSRACERLQWFLHFVEHEKSVSSTCSHFGIARSTFHRWMDRFDPNDLSTLEERAHDPVNARQATVPQEVIELIRRYRMRWPQIGKERLQQLLQEDHSMAISASSIGRIIERECMYFGDTPLHWKKRLHQHSDRQVSETDETEQMTVDMPAMEIVEPFITEPQAHETVHVPVTRASAETHHAHTPHCLFCTIRSRGWQSFRRALLFTSLAINLVLIGLMLATAFWEHDNAQQRHAAADDQPAVYTHTELNLN